MIHRRDFLRSLVVVPAVGTLGVRSLLAADEAPAKPNVQTITLYNTGDMHDHSGNLARLAGFIKREKARDPNVLFVDAGDYMNKGEAQMAATGGEGMIHLMSKCGYDAAAVGNHDCVHGADAVLNNYAKHKTFPLALCNVRWSEADKKVAVVPRYRIFNCSGVRVCIASAVSHIQNHSHGKKFKLIHEREGYNEIWPTIKEAADVFIFLTHLYDHNDRRLVMWWADHTPHVMVGAHTHARKVWQQGKTLIVKAGFWGRCIGKTTIKFDLTNRKFLSAGARVHNLGGDWPIDKEVADLRAWYMAGRPKKTASMAMRERVLTV